MTKQELCREFERMKEQLAENNHQLWKMIEEEKALRAAIAHDIRSPLSVLEGYQEMLSEYLPKKEINMEQMELIRSRNLPMWFMLLGIGATGTGALAFMRKKKH